MDAQGHVPLPGAFIVYDGKDWRIQEILPFRHSPLEALCLLLIGLPDIDHVAEHLHAHIVVRHRLVLYQGHKGIEKIIPWKKGVFPPPMCTRFTLSELRSSANSVMYCSDTSLMSSGLTSFRYGRST